MEDLLLGCGNPICTWRRVSMTIPKKSWQLGKVGKEIPGRCIPDSYWRQFLEFLVPTTCLSLLLWETRIDKTQVCSLFSAQQS